MRVDKKLLYWISALFLISTACAFAATETNLQITLTAASRETAEGQTGGIVTESPTPFVSWEGSWTTWIIIGEPHQVTMTLLQSGNDIRGTSTAADGTVADLDGRLSADFGQASGTWGDLEDSGTFEWRQINPNQFIGHYTIDPEDRITIPWCGARNGAPRPDPCLGP